MFSVNAGLLYAISHLCGSGKCSKFLLNTVIFSHYTFFGKNHSIGAYRVFLRKPKTHKPRTMCNKEYAEMLSFSLFISYTITAQIPQNFQRCIVTDMKCSKGFEFTFEGFLQKPILKNSSMTRDCKPI